MKTAVWLLVLVTASAVLAKPTHKQKLDIKRGLSSLLRKLRQSSGNCRELSEAFGELAQHAGSLVLPFSSMEIIMDMNDLNDIMDQFIDMMFGFDIVNDNEAREVYTCAITQAGSLSELKAALEDNNLLHKLYRMLYDVDVVALHAVKSATYGAQLDFLNAAESVGLMNLDNARVQVIKDLLSPFVGQFFAQYVPAVPFTGTNSAKCDRVNNAFRNLYLQEVANEPNAPHGIAMFQHYTGIDISDYDQIRSLFCDVIDGADDGLDGVYAAFDSHGVISSLFRAVYPLIQTYVPLGRSVIEQTLQQLSGGGPGPSPGGQYPGGQYPGGQYPNYPNYPQYGDMSPTKRDHKRSLKKRTNEKHSDKKRSYNGGSNPGNGGSNGGGYPGYGGGYPGDGGSYPGYGGGYPGNGGSYPGYGGGYPGNGGSYPGYGGGYPGNGGGYPGYGGGYPGNGGSGGPQVPGLEEQIQLMTLVHRFLEALENSGLLSLTNDL